MSKFIIESKKKYISVLGEERYVCVPKRACLIEKDQLVSYVSHSAGIPESAFLAATEAMFEAISYFVCNGHHVELGKLGNMGPRITTKALADASEITSPLAARLGISFQPSPELKALLSDVSFTTPSTPSSL